MASHQKPESWTATLDCYTRIHVSSMADSSESQTWPVLVFCETRQCLFFHSLPPPFFILDWDSDHFGGLYFPHASPLKWTHCEWKYPALQVVNRGETGGSSEKQNPGCCLTHTRLWNAVCTTYGLSRAQQFPQKELCKFVSRLHGNVAKRK